MTREPMIYLAVAAPEFAHQEQAARAALDTGPGVGVYVAKKLGETAMIDGKLGYVCLDEECNCGSPAYEEEWGEWVYVEKGTP